MGLTYTGTPGFGSGVQGLVQTKSGDLPNEGEGFQTRAVQFGRAA